MLVVNRCVRILRGCRAAASIRLESRRPVLSFSTITDIQNEEAFKAYLKDLGDIPDLLASISNLGEMLQPKYLNYAFAVCCLMRYEELHGTMLVPQKFRVPDKCDLWPEEAWGVRLGRWVIHIRRGVTFASKKEELRSIGFDFTPQKARYGYNTVKPALIRYKQLHGDMLATLKYQVPESDLWPEEMWKMKLGSIVSEIRNNSCYESKKEELIELGFEFSSQSMTWSFETAKSALLQYKEMYGDMRVRRRFIIPDKNDRWTQDTWGMTLGRTVHFIQTKGKYKEHSQELLEMGFDFTVKLEKHGFEKSEIYGFEALKTALVKYNALHGNIIVPEDFIVPENNDDWHPCTWDMKLGRVVLDVRRGLMYKSKEDELLLLGFEFDEKEDEKVDNKVTSALMLYAEKEKDSKKIPISFIIPSDESWPEEMWGMQLGAILDSILTTRSQNKQELRAELRGMGFRAIKPRQRRSDYMGVDSGVEEGVGKPAATKLKRLKVMKEDTSSSRPIAHSTTSSSSSSSSSCSSRPIADSSGRPIAHSRRSLVGRRIDDSFLSPANP